MSWEDELDQYHDYNSRWAVPNEQGSYETTLTQEQKAEFDKWVSENKKLGYVRGYLEGIPGKQTYDLPGFWLGVQSGDPRAVSGIDPVDGMMHATDTWKTPYHKSFSRESIYAAKDAPEWRGEGKDAKLYHGDKVVFDPIQEEAKRQRGNKKMAGLYDFNLAGAGSGSMVPQFGGAGAGPSWSLAGGWEGAVSPNLANSVADFATRNMDPGYGYDGGYESVYSSGLDTSSQLSPAYQGMSDDALRKAMEYPEFLSRDLNTDYAQQVVDYALDPKTGRPALGKTPTTPASGDAFNKRLGVKSAQYGLVPETFDKPWKNVLNILGGVAKKGVDAYAKRTGERAKDIMQSPDAPADASGLARPRLASGDASPIPDMDQASLALALSGRAAHAPFQPLFTV